MAVWPQPCKEDKSMFAMAVPFIIKCIWAAAAVDAAATASGLK